MLPIHFSGNPFSRAYLRSLDVVYRLLACVIGPRLDAYPMLSPMSIYVVSSEPWKSASQVDCPGDGQGCR